MKVKIGPYTNWFGPYQLAEKLCFWAKEEKDEYGITKKPDWVHNFGEWLAHGSVKPEPKVGEITSWDYDRPTTMLYRFLSWIHSKQKRTINVHIDPWDTWSMDDTLAHIVLPMLKQLKEKKHGAPFVDLKDVPKELHGKRLTKKQKANGEVDDKHFERWDWVMDEMIWAFEQKHPDCDWCDQYYSGESDTFMAPVDKDGNDVEKKDAKYFEMRRGPNDTFKIDREGMDAHQARITNGFRLFGKYYEGLWD